MPNVPPWSAYANSAFCRVIGLIMVLPFVLLSLLAQGTMVSAGPTPNSFMVVLCDEHLPVEMVIDEQGRVVKADEYRARQDAPVPKTLKPSCDWAGHAQPVVANPPTVQAARLDVPRPTELVAHYDFRTLRAQVLAPSARGPPAA